MLSVRGGRNGSIRALEVTDPAEPRELPVAVARVRTDPSMPLALAAPPPPPGVPPSADPERHAGSGCAMGGAAAPAGAVLLQGVAAVLVTALRRSGREHGGSQSDV